MRELYNKSALNRIMTQDNLDKTIILVSPSLWVSIVGAFLIIGGLLLWGMLGKLPTSVDVQGIYINEGGMNSIYSQADGFITDIKVEKGQSISEGSLVATLGTEEDVYQIQQLDTRISYVENMTFDSEMDTVTNDTQPLAQIKLNAKNTDKNLEETKASLEMKKEKLADAKAEAEAKEAEMLQYKEKYYATLSVTDKKNEVNYTEANSEYESRFNLYEQSKTSYITAKESYNTKKADFDAKYADYDPDAVSEEEKDAHDAALSEVESAGTTAEDYRILMEQAGEKLTSANDTLTKVRTDYLTYLNGLSGTQAENIVASTEYSESLQRYTTAKQTYNSINDEVDELELKAVMDEGESEQSGEDYEQQFDNQKSAVLLDLKAQRDSLLNKADQGQIIANAQGEIYDIPVSVGMAVNKGATILNLLCGDLSDDTVICYVPLTDAKKLESGMEAHVYPSTVNKQEYGHIVSKVDFVNGYVASVEDILHYEEDSIYLAEKDETQNLEKLRGEIELSNISFAYGKLDKPFIRRFDFHVKSGQSIALVGSSGCGKSTVAKLLSALYEPWDGEILFDGRPYSQIPEEIIRASVSVVSQDLSLFDGSIYDNITMWNSNIRQEDVIQAAKDACVHEEITKKPGAYDYLVKEGGANLSGGQRQRIEIAKALATNPTVLILDEATSSLDAVTEKKILNHIKRRHCTCIVVAQRLSTIRDCDEIIVMEHGKIVERGTHEVLMERNGKYKRLIVSA